jgi:endonuclease/exonuclease/phosphatase family metal-dependent hydrolase
MSLRIVTWNTNNWKQSEEQRAQPLSYLMKTVHPDIALLQEVLAPLPQVGCMRYQVGDLGPDQGWRSQVFRAAGWMTEVTTVKSPRMSREMPLMRSYPGCVAISHTLPADDSLLTAISVDAVFDGGTAQTTMLRILADLIPLFETAPLNHYMVLGGDLNISTLGRASDPAVRRSGVILDYLETFGFVDCLDQSFGEPRHLANCPCGQALCRHTRTRRRPESPDVPDSTDYLFASRAMAERLISCRAHDTEEAWAFSDHCPVIADFDF